MPPSNLCIKRLPLVALVWCVCTAAQASAAVQFRFDSWTTDNGLPQVSINSILQTRDGFLWLTTYGGLVRYDGLRFQVFNTGNTKGLRTSRLTVLLEDREGNLWVGTEGRGIIRYKDGAFTTYTTDDGLPTNQVLRMEGDADGNLLLEIGDSLLRWTGEGFAPYSPRAGEPVKGVLQRTPTGAVWSWDGTRLRKFEGGRVTVDVAPGVRVLRAFEDSRGRVWIAADGSDDLLVLEDGGLTSLRVGDGPPQNRFSVAFEDRQQRVWFGTASGLLLFKDGELTRYTTAVGLVLLNASNQIVDAVGFTGTPAPYFEGAVPTPAGGAGEYSFVRKLAGGTPQDTGDNAGDFVLVSTDGADGSAPATLGAPGPEGLSSPVERTSRFGAFLLDATQSSASPPNRIRGFTSSPANNSTFGTVSIRRRFTNNTGAAVTRLRFRVVIITGYPVADSTLADLRVLTSTDTTVGGVADPNTCAASGLSQPCTVTVRGTALETPPAQALGGGLNSSLSVSAVTTAPETFGGDEVAVGGAPTFEADGDAPVSPGPAVTSDTIGLDTPLANGASINVQFLLGIQKTGKFRFYLNLEALP